MTSYLVDGVLLLALLATSLRMAAVHRELKRLRVLHAEFRHMSDRLADGLGLVRAAVADMDRRGRSRIDDVA
jgi:hypothetical protein